MQQAHNELINEVTRNFVAAHANDDVRRLALSTTPQPGVDLRVALDQISGRQCARTKLPTWAATEGIIYPPHLSLEQCSSEAAARYKASLVSGNTLVDLTGGMGVDCFFLSQTFNTTTYVERQASLCSIALHNFHLLNNDKIEVVNADAVEHLNHMAPVDTIYIDPARRDTDGRRTYGIAQCTPDVAALATLLLTKARRVLVKLSPMLDVSEVMNTLPQVAQVHIVSIGGECKELLVIMSRESTHSEPSVHCVNDDDIFTYNLDDDVARAPLWDETISTQSPVFLYEPNASIMKAGCFDRLAIRLGMKLMSRDSHLLVADKPCDKFPGRGFIVKRTSSLNKRDIKQALAGITAANVAVRNFPMRAAELAKRLRLADGGQTYIFGTTTAQGKHIILVCEKITS